MRRTGVPKTWPRLVLGFAVPAMLAVAGSGPASAAQAGRGAALPACTDSWTGLATSPQWTIASNWSTGKVPGPTSDVCITSTGDDVLTSVSIKIHSLQIGSEQGIALEGTTAKPLTATIATSLTVTGGVIARIDLTDATVNAGQISDQDGTIFSDGNVTLNSPDIAFSDGGSVQAANGTMKLTSLPQLSGGTLTGASFQVSGGTIVLPADVTHLVSSSLIVGFNSAIDDPAGHNALAGLSSVDSRSSLTDDSDLPLTGSLTASGNVSLGGPAASLAGTLTQTGGILGVGTNLSASQVMVRPGAALDSSGGTIAGNLVNDGTIQTGGTLSVTGNYTQGAKATMAEGFGDPIAVTGKATLAGSVSTFEPLPVAGDTEPVVTFGSLSGGFTRQTPGFMLVTRPGEIEAIILPQIAATPTKVAPNGSVTVTGGSFTLGGTVSIYLDHVGGTPLATATPGYGGRFSAPVTIPASVRAGRHMLIAVGAGNGGKAQTTIRVT